MKKLIVILFILLYASSCNDPGEAYMESFQVCSEDGLIIGQDFTRWICGGGYYIKVNSDTIRTFEIPNPLIEEQANQLGSIWNTDNIGIPVRLSYEQDNSACNEFVRKITCIVRRTEL